MNFNCFQKNSAKFLYFSCEQFKLHQDKVSDDIQLFKVKILCSHLAPQHCNYCNKITCSDPGSCIQKGFQGCCDPNLSSECYGSAGTSCYCDELCYQFNDCCFDIDQIGCLGKVF